MFRGEKGPALEQLASLQAKEILEGHLAATRAREVAATAEAPSPTPRPRGHAPPGPILARFVAVLDPALLSSAALLALLPLLGPGRTR